MRKRDEIVVSLPIAIHNGATSTPHHGASGHTIAGASWVRVVAVQIVQCAALFSQIGASPATAITRDSCIGEQELRAPGGLTQCTVRDVEFHGMYNARVQQPSRHTVGQREYVHVRACGALSPFELFPWCMCDWLRESLTLRRFAVGK